MAVEAITCSNQIQNAQGEVLPASYKVYMCGWESLPISISGTWNYASSVTPPCNTLSPTSPTAFTLLPNGGGPNTCDTTYFLDGVPFSIILLFPTTPYTVKYIPVFGFDPSPTGGYITNTCTESTIDITVTLQTMGTCIINVHITGVTF